MAEKAKSLSLPELVDKRNTILNRLQEWNEEKRRVESTLFKKLIQAERVEYFTINWRKLHSDATRGRLAD